MARLWLSASLASSFALFALACGHRPEGAPAVPPVASAEPEGDSDSAAPAPSAGEPAAPKRRRKPFEIHNSCPEITTLLFGEDPKDAAAGRRAIAANSTIDGPRDEDGKQTVWLLDQQGEPLVNVHITRGMKKLEIGRSCRTLDAR